MKPKEIRETLGLTQEKFAQKLGISVMTVRRWEKTNNPTNPSPMAEKLMQEIIYQIEPEKVLSYSKDRQLRKQKP